MSGPPQPKNIPYRNQKLRDLAKEVNCCQFCKCSLISGVVLAHSNKLKNGKGRGQKAHDIPMYLCQYCHDLYDGRTPGWGTEHKLMCEAEAVYNSFLWLLQNGHLEVK